MAEVWQRLGSQDAEQAWTGFLDQYSGLILQVVRLIARDEDAAADCFLFVCERLAAGGCRRLRRFLADGPATFETWLRAVVRNLTLDWRRTQVGRLRVFESIERLGDLDRAVFREVLERGATHEAAFWTLHPRHPELTREGFEAALDRVRAALSPRQRWLLASRERREIALPADPGEDGVSPIDRAADERPDPETLAWFAECRHRLAAALQSLPASDLLLVKLRFDEDLTFDQIARLAGLKDAQSAHRRIEAILADLRRKLDAAGKPAPASVKDRYA